MNPHDLSAARHAAAHLTHLLRRERHAMADFLLALASFDRQRGWAALGHANLWAFLHRDLGLSAGAASHRKTAAALLQRFPGVEAPLRDGRLCLSSVIELAHVLTPENEAQVLPRFFHLSARQAKQVVAELQPRAVVPSRTVVTNVAPPGRDVRWQAGISVQTSERSGTPKEGSAEPGRGVGFPVRMPQVLTPAPLPIAAPAVASAPVATPAAAAAPPPDSTDPLTGDLSRLHVTVSRRFLAKLEAARAARGHAQPRASDEAILEAALDLLLAHEARRREGVVARPLAVPRSARPGHVSAEVRREVWARDQGRCQWPLHDGDRCGSTHHLEVDHVLPRARGGTSTAANLRLLCRAHNAEAARLAFGTGWMARFTGAAAPG